MAPSNDIISTAPSHSWLSPPPVAPHLPHSPQDTFEDSQYTRPQSNPSLAHAQSNQSIAHNHSNLSIHTQGTEDDDEIAVPLQQQYPQFSRDRLLVESSDEDDDFLFKKPSHNYKRPPTSLGTSSAALLPASKRTSSTSAAAAYATARLSQSSGARLSNSSAARLSHSSAGSARSGSAGGYRRSNASNISHHTRSSSTSTSAPLSTRQIREFSSFGLAAPGSHIPNTKREGVSGSELTGSRNDVETIRERGMGRRKSYNVNRHSITNAAYYCVSSSVYLGLVFGLEMKAPGELIFLPHDIWRFPFLYAAIISWALLIFGFFIQCTILGIGRTRNEQIGRRKSYMISLAPNARIPVVIALLWVSVGLIAAGIGSIFVFMGLKNRAEKIHALQSDPFQRYVLPIIGGILSALINAIMALACFIAGVRALKSLPSPNSSRKSKRSKDSKGNSRSRSRDDIAIPIDGNGTNSFGSAQPAGHYESWGSNNPISNSHTNNNYNSNNPNISNGNIYLPPTAPPRVSSEHLPQLSRAEIDKRLGQLEEMGFRNQQENYEALYASNFVVSVAAQRLRDSQRI